MRGAGCGVHSENGNGEMNRFFGENLEGVKKNGWRDGNL